MAAWWAHWWAWFTASNAPADLALIAFILTLGLFWPKPEPEPKAGPCSCDGYNGFTCPQHLPKE